MNPYQPPSAGSPPASFLKRFKHASHRAYKAYRAGVQRDRLLRGELVSAWISLFLIAAILLAFGISLIMIVADFVMRTELTGVSF